MQRVCNEIISKVSTMIQRIEWAIFMMSIKFHVRLFVKNLIMNYFIHLLRFGLIVLQ